MSGARPAPVSRSGPLARAAQHAALHRAARHRNSAPHLSVPPALPALRVTGTPARRPRETRSRRLSGTPAVGISTCSPPKFHSAAIPVDQVCGLHGTGILQYLQPPVEVAAVDRPD